MSKANEMEAGKTKFVDKLGAYYESYGVPRIGGRIIGLLLMSGEALSPEMIAGNLCVSRASVSTNIRLLLLYGFVEAARRDGRTDFYTIAEDAWGKAVEARAEGFRRLKALAELGAEALGGDAGASRKVREMADWADVMILGHERIQADWDSRKRP